MKCIISILCLLCLFVANTQAGGSWLVDGQAVQALEVQTTNADPDALYTDGTRTMQAPLAFDAAVSSPTNGLVRAYFAPEGGNVDLLVLDEDEEALWLSSSPNVALRIGDMLVSSSQMANIPAGTKVAFEDHMLEGGWMMDSVMDQPFAILNRSYADARYLRQASPITTPLLFDQSLSTPTNGLLQAWFEPEAAFVDLLILDGDEEVLWLSDSANVTLRVGDMYLSSSSLFNVSSGARVSVEDRMFEGGWMTDSVPNHNLAVINRSYADTRYIKRSEGISTNHTFQTGDVLQIQNGIITAINP